MIHRCTDRLTRPLRAEMPRLSSLTATSEDGAGVRKTRGMSRRLCFLAVSEHAVSKSMEGEEFDWNVLTPHAL